MSQPLFTSASELLAGLEAGTYSSVELTSQVLDAIEDQDATLNAYIAVDRDGALSRAKQADEARAKGNKQALLGVPMAHKDIFCTDELPTTCGSRMLQDYVSPYTAHVVDRLNGAGTVMLGKTNMDEFAMGSSNENSFYGPVANPWDNNRVPGGSSGGSAAAVAAGLAVFATGTDTGGSIRQPASFCGVTGLKPTYGCVSRYGMVAFASSLDQGGVFARTAEDAALVLAAMAGHDPRDSTSVTDIPQWLTQATPITEVAAQTALSAGLTIGLPKEYLQNFDATHIDAMRQQLESMGHRTIEVSLPHTDAAIPAYYVIAGAEASTNLSRYDGVRFGYRCDNPRDLDDLLMRSRSEGLGPEVQRRILTGTYALSVGYYDAYYLKAQKVRRLIAQDFVSAFTEADVLLAPTAPGPAFGRDELTADPVAMYQQDRFTVPVSLAGLPALSLPCGFSEVDGRRLPLGAQLIGPAFREDLILALAHAYQGITDWHTQTPNGQV